MKKALLAIACVGTALAAVSSANASGGCGPGFHRGPYGGCRPNGVYGPGPGPAVIAPGLAIGVFYPGRGYWDGHRYWGHRDRWHGGWRYR